MLIIFDLLLDVFLPHYTIIFPPFITQTCPPLPGLVPSDIYYPSLKHHFRFCQSVAESLGFRHTCRSPCASTPLLLESSPTASLSAWQEGWSLSPFSVRRRWNDIWAPCQMWVYPPLMRRCQEWSLLFQPPVPEEGFWRFAPTHPATPPRPALR